MRITTNLLGLGALAAVAAVGAGSCVVTSDGGGGSGGSATSAGGGGASAGGGGSSAGGGGAGGGGSWTCDPTYLGDGALCDCGCGIPDPDCADGAAASCDYCDDAGSCNPFACPGNIDATDNSQCAQAIPGWTCNPPYYGDGECDCGCGIVDSDCADATVASCQYCDDEGSCSSTTCPGTIDPANNAACQ